VTGRDLANSSVKCGFRAPEPALRSRLFDRGLSTSPWPYPVSPLSVRQEHLLLQLFDPTPVFSALFSRSLYCGRSLVFFAADFSITTEHEPLPIGPKMYRCDAPNLVLTDLCRHLNACQPGGHSAHRPTGQTDGALGVRQTELGQLSCHSTVGVHRSFCEQVSPIRGDRGLAMLTGGQISNC
jgi:hypothetical protein